MGRTTRFPSLAINWSGTALPLASARVSIHQREIVAARIRKRYLRGRTSKNGAYAKFTSGMSPINPSTAKTSKKS